MVRYLRIDSSHPLYPQTLELRERILLAPVGYDIAAFESAYPAARNFLHFIAAIDHPQGERVVGVVCLIPNHPEKGVGKLMQMAVDPQRQREGIGRRLVIELERTAFGDLGLKTLFCHAQETAVDFYLRLGWEVEGEAFDEAGIPHRKMVIRAPEGGAEAATDVGGGQSGLDQKSPYGV